MPQRVNTAYIAREARRYNIDPRALLAVWGQEGLGGGIGDNGTSFGPGQLHYGGAYPSSAPHGSPAESQAWAWSPQGIAYALREVASVAGGEHGAQAVRDIVTRFERPADPRGEIARALANYGGPVAEAGGGNVYPGLANQPAGQPASAIGPSRQQIAEALIAQIGRKNPNYTSVGELLNAQKDVSGMGVDKAGTGQGHASSSTSPLAFLSSLGKQYGLTVTSTTGGQHVPNSYHYRGRAEDYAGSPAQMRALMDYALAHPSQFVEAFYDPAGKYVKNGRVYSGSIGGHSDHVHLAR